MSNPATTALVNALVDIARGANAPEQRTTDVLIEHEGTKIKLPALPTPMSPGEACKHLQRLEASQQTKVAVNEEIDANPYEGAVALTKAIAQQYGWADAIPTPGFWKDNPPAKLSISVSADKRIDVLWGRFTLPGMDGYLQTSMGENFRGEAIFQITGEIKQKDYPLVCSLAQLTRKIAREQSIYKGKALQLLTVDGELKSAPPEFLTPTKKDPLILPETVQRSLEANVFTIVEKSEICRKAGIPLKRGIILAGPPGTGKTLTAQDLAIRAPAAGWTYILIEEASAIASAIRFAKRYAPCVVFCEDIDRHTSGARDEELDSLLNTIDGVDTKNKDIMLVFTSNNITEMERTLVRPGRIDAIIQFPTPDQVTIEKFLRHYSNGLIRQEEPLTKSSDALLGAIPAIIREAVERAKLYAIARGVSLENMQLTDDDVFVAVETLKAHTDFFHSERKQVVSVEEQLGAAVVAAVSSAIEAKFSNSCTVIKGGETITTAVVD